MQKVSENQEGFNSQIKTQQSKRGYKKLNSKIHNKRPLRNPKVLEDSLKAKWLKEIKEVEPKIPKTSGLLKWQMKSRKYYKKIKYIILPEVYQKQYHQQEGNS